MPETAMNLEGRQEACNNPESGEKIARLQLLHICSNCQFYTLVSMVNLVNTVYSIFHLTFRTNKTAPRTAIMKHST